MFYFRQCIVITDGRSRRPSKTSDEARLCRSDGITMTAIGIKGAEYDELLAIAGDASRTFHVNTFDDLGKLAKDIEKTTCKGECLGVQRGFYGDKALSVIIDI